MIRNNVETEIASRSGINPQEKAPDGSGNGRNGLPSDVTKEVIEDAPSKDNDVVARALEQVNINPEWYEKYDNFDDRELRERIEEIVGEAFETGGETAGTIGLAVLRGYQFTKPLQEMRDVMKEGEEGWDVHIPNWLAIVTLPKNFPEIAAEKMRSAGKKIGEIVHNAIKEIKQEIEEEKIENDIETFFVSEGVIRN